MLTPFLPVPRDRPRRRRASGSTGTSRRRSARCAGSRARSGCSCAPTRSCGCGARRCGDMSEVAVLNANYVLARLRDAYDLPVDRLCMHEFVVSARTLRREHGVTALDVAKRLMDYGFHPPTIYFPLIVSEALMIEPTETEALETLDAFCDAMIAIAREAADDPQLLKDAPHTRPVRRLDEAEAAKRLHGSLPVRGAPDLGVAPMLEAVIFDYGHTLLDFRFDEDLWLGCLRDMLTAAGGDPERAPDLRDELRRRFSTLSADPGRPRGAGLRRGGRGGAGRVRRVAGAGPGAGGHRGRAPRLGERAPGCTPRRTGCSMPSGPAAFGSASSRTRSTRPTCFHADVAADGVAERVDAVVFSSEIGLRKPAPQIYEAALAAAGRPACGRPLRRRPGARGRAGPGRPRHAHMPRHVLPRRRRRPQPRGLGGGEPGRGAGGRRQDHVRGRRPGKL